MVAYNFDPMSIVGEKLSSVGQHGSHVVYASRLYMIILYNTTDGYHLYSSMFYIYLKHSDIVSMVAKVKNYLT